MRERGFEKISYPQFEKDFENYLSNPKEAYDNLKLPIRKTRGSAGYDINTLFSFSLKPGESILVPTGLKAYMMQNEFLAIVARSSLGIKKGIMLKNQIGIIDHDYYQNISNEGHFMIGLVNMGNEIWECEKGQGIAQGIFLPFLVTDNDDVSGKLRVGGLGSTDKEK